MQSRPGEGVGLLDAGPLRDAVSCAPSKASSNGVGDVCEGQLQCNFDDARIRMSRTSVDASVSPSQVSSPMSSKTHACQHWHRQPGQRRNRGPSAANLQVGCRSSRTGLGRNPSNDDGQCCTLENRLMGEPRDDKMALQRTSVVRLVLRGSVLARLVTCVRRPKGSMCSTYIHKSEHVPSGVHRVPCQVGNNAKYVVAFRAARVRSELNIGKLWGYCVSPDDDHDPNREPSCKLWSH